MSGASARIPLDSWPKLRHLPARNRKWSKTMTFQRYHGQINALGVRSNLRPFALELRLAWEGRPDLP